MEQLRKKTHLLSMKYTGNCSADKYELMIETSVLDKTFK